MQLTIWDKKIQQLLSSTDASGVMLACSLVGEDGVWSVWLWYYLCAMEDPRVYHLPALLPTTIADVVSNNYDIGELATKICRSSNTLLTAERYWPTYLSGLYETYKSRQ